ncbi:MAG TPA: amylo-alpha-1,6-glucosidase [Polyangiaceae bacterium]|nr:amylo-alpha-1,6-glucosidase [Polyangiaceae bacterium]
MPPEPESEHAPDHHIVGSASHETEGGRVLKHDDAFLIVDRLGEILPTGRGEQGIYYRGTRYVSRLRVRFAKRPSMLLCSSVLENNVLLAVDLSNPEMKGENHVVEHGTVHLARRALLRDNAYFERVHVRNYSGGVVSFPLTIEFDADFADIFEVRGTPRNARGERKQAEIDERAVRIPYVGLDGVERRTELEFSRRPDGISATEASFELTLPPAGELELEWSITFRPALHPVPRPANFDAAAGAALETLHRDQAGETRVLTSNGHFNRWLDRSRADLRMLSTATEYGSYPYAGVPWFSTPFGRDGIITALQMLWVDQKMAAGVLRFLGANQATELDPAADAEPGKIVHEMRDGEMARLHEVPFGRYYGSIDSTPLYVMLAAAYFDVTGDLGLVREIWPHLERAIGWLDEYGDQDGDGFVEYGRRSTDGLVQQGWKDSQDSVSHSDGTLAEGPIALCEVQGYAFAARLGFARLARALGDTARADRSERLARELQTRFDEAFWRPELGMYALALDGKKRPCRVRSSNAGHCLYTRIALPSRVAPLHDALLSDAMFSGWGVRTLGANEARYNPMSYHNGSVWPHDNAIIALGFSEFADRTLPLRLLESFYEAASFVDFQRLPELFCGFVRRPGQEPIRYPVACLPQAWAAASPFSLLRAVLGLETDARKERVVFCRPRLPGFIDSVEIRRLRVGNQRVDLRLVRQGDDVGVTVLEKSGNVDVAVVKTTAQGSPATNGAPLAAP